MTPDEIRKMIPVDSECTFQNAMLQEIACQLAEFNGNFRMINGIVPPQTESSSSTSGQPAKE